MGIDSMICKLCNSIYFSGEGLICLETGLSLCSECIFEHFEKRVEDFEEDECFCLYEEPYQEVLTKIIEGPQEVYYLTDEYSSEDDLSNFDN